ncbi:MAG: SDR family NAD(P)-dependent oxidoreductase [Acidimicrobiales bacterium]
MPRRIDLGNLADHRVIVTGANSGIGLAATQRLLDAGARVTMACRSTEKAQAARADLHGLERAEVAELNVADPASIQRFADEFRARHDRLDLLINNAGVMATPPALTEEGIERQWATNVLGPFALTGRLLDLLAATDASRVIAVGSLAAQSGVLTAHDPTNLYGYDRFSVYAATKLADLVYTVELGRRLKRHGVDVIAAAGHPGFTHTNLASGLGNPFLTEMVRAAGRLMAQSAGDGAEPILAAACLPAVTDGAYFGPAGWGQYRGEARLVPLPRAANDAAAGERLWNQSVQLSDVDYLT